MKECILRQANVVAALVSDRVSGYDNDHGDEGTSGGGSTGNGNKRRRVDGGGDIKSALEELASRFA